MGWLNVGVNIWIVLVGRLIMMSWDVMTVGLPMAYWIIAIGVFILPPILSIFVRTILIVLVILKCIFYVMNFFNNIIYF